MLRVSRDAWPLVVLRAVFCMSLLVTGALSVRFTQILAWAVCGRSPRWYYACINVTKQHFMYLITFITSFVNPCKIKITFEAKNLPEDNNFRVDIDGNLFSMLSPNAVYIANHQIYTDWVFFWFLTYTGKLADSIYIVLKESLARVPVIGPGMVNYKFLFLSRKWETDKVNLTNQLLEIDANARGYGPASGVTKVSSAKALNGAIKTWPKGLSKNQSNKAPYQLVIFPEGTVISPHTRDRSAKYCEKVGRPPLKHVLLPRARGLFLMLRSLRDTVDVVYDVAFGYSGLTAADYGEEVYTLKALYLKGKGPSCINYHIQGYNIKDIPLGDDDEVDVDNVDPEVLHKFEDWLFDVWYAKDKLMARFFETGTFSDPDNLNEQSVFADFKLRSFMEWISPFTIIGSFLLIVYMTIKFIVNQFASHSS